MGPSSPSIGEVLAHKFRRKLRQVQAIVTSVDRTSGSVTVEMDGKEYPPLLAVAKPISGSNQNARTHSGVKKQKTARKLDKTT